MHSCPCTPGPSEPPSLRAPAQGIVPARGARPPRSSCTLSPPWLGFGSRQHQRAAGGARGSRAWRRAGRQRGRGRSPPAAVGSPARRPGLLHAGQRRAPYKSPGGAGGGAVSLAGGSERVLRCHGGGRGHGEGTAGAQVLPLPQPRLRGARQRPRRALPLEAVPVREVLAHHRAAEDHGSPESPEAAGDRAAGQGRRRARSVGRRPWGGSPGGRCPRALQP